MNQRNFNQNKIPNIFFRQKNLKIMSAKKPLMVNICHVIRLCQIKMSYPFKTVKFHLDHVFHNKCKITVNSDIPFSVMDLSFLDHFDHVFHNKCKITVISYIPFSIMDLSFLDHLDHVFHNKCKITVNSDIPFSVMDWISWLQTSIFFLCQT